MYVDLTATILTLKHLLISIHIISMIRKRNSYIKIELTYNTTGVINCNIPCPTT